MWTREYRILDFRADPEEIKQQVQSGYNPGVRLVMDDPIGREIKVAINEIQGDNGSYHFKGFLCETVRDYNIGQEFWRETDIKGYIRFWKGRLTMTSTCSIKT